MSDEEFLPLIFRNLQEIRERLTRILILFGLLVSLFLVVRIQNLTILGYTFPFLYPSIYHNISTQFLVLVEQHVLPKGTTVFVLKPADGVVADLDISMFLGLIFTMPLIVKEIGEFVGPALKRREKDALRSVVLPATALFTAGAVIGLWYVAPPLFDIFNGYDVGLGAASTLSLMSFISFLTIYTISFGISFEVPVFMVGLTRTGMVSAKFWREHWRHAIIGALIFGMIFSPGVIGFTMVIMALPIITLYVGGIYFAERAERKREEETMKMASEV